MKKRDILCLMLVLSGLVLSCNLMSAIQGNPELNTIKQTEVAINVQQTLMATVPETIESPNQEQVQPEQNEKQKEQEAQATIQDQELALPTQPLSQPAETQGNPNGEAKVSESLYLGDVVEKYGYLLSTIAVEDPATPTGIYVPVSGKKLIAVEVIIGNVTGEPLMPNPMFATLLDSEGVIYNPVVEGREGKFVLVYLGPSEKERVWIAFEVPEDTTVASIKYACDGILGSKVLQASLKPPPEGYVPNTVALSIKQPPLEVGLGDVFEKNGYSLSATAVEDPTTRSNILGTKEGNKLVAVEIEVGNVSGKTLKVDPILTNELLVDSNGFVYATKLELYGQDGQLAKGDLNAGEKAKGWVAFEVPKDATPASIKYKLDFFSTIFLQVGLTE